MEREKMRYLQRYFHDELLNNTLPFWVKHAVDRRYGGFTNFLDRKGGVLNTDKAMWIQARFAWILARLYNDLEPRPEWLELSGHGVDFIKKHGFDKDGRMFFLVTQDGKPLRKRRYLFTETFGIIAFAEYARASGDKEALEIAKRIMRLVLDLYKNPKGMEPKIIPETRKLRSHSMAMIQVNTFQVLRRADEENGGLYGSFIDNAIDEVFSYFVKPEKKALFETVGINGELMDSPEGRCINPGHAIETAWFILEEGRHRKDKGMIERALPIIDWSLERGWDDRYGGMFYFVDAEGKQPEQLEWDMKLWWVHNECIYATLLAYHLTGDRKYEDWFGKVLTWTLDHFPDREYGEWFGYLHRDGTVALDLKGSTWKGPFHLPRQQLYTYLLLSDMLGGNVSPT
jgi:N-acylglucosamine 2-epimerase